jgi:hypothetical protein
MCASVRSVTSRNQPGPLPRFELRQ